MGETTVLALLAAALAASLQPPAPEPVASEAATPNATTETSAAGSEALESALPWWERITVTVDAKGKQQSCRYETSSSVAGAEECGEEMAASLPTRRAGHDGLYSKMTFERRFSPGGRVDNGQLQPGDTLLGRKVIFLTLDASGKIDSCKVVATTGDAPADYGCDEARKEQFKAHASANPAARQAFMTILAYGHVEEVV